MNKVCRKCKSGQMHEVHTASDVNYRGVSVHVQGLRHFECENCHAQIETPNQIDANAELIKVYLKVENA